MTAQTASVLRTNLPKTFVRARRTVRALDSTSSRARACACARACVRSLVCIRIGVRARVSVCVRECTRACVRAYTGQRTSRRFVCCWRHAISMHACTPPLPTGTPACMPPRLDAGANFETLRDGCTALILRPGQRLKIDLADLYNGGMAARKRRLLAKLDSDADGGGAAVHRLQCCRRWSRLSWFGWRRRRRRRRGRLSGFRRLRQEHGRVSRRATTNADAHARTLARSLARGR